MKAVVVGSGGWGTALAILLLDNGHEVTLWSYHEVTTAALAETGENHLLPGVPLPKALTLTSSLDAVSGADLVVMATPSFAVRETAKKLAPLLGKGAVVVSVSKGIEKDTSLRLSQVIRQELGEKENPVVVLSGPSHAEEVGRHMPTGVVAASEDAGAAELVQGAFMNRRFRVYTTPDTVGVETAAALKNVMALCSGICDGLGYGDNTRAMLMTRGLTEIARLGMALGASRETFAGLAGVGDLIVTCTSMHSRNYRAGRLIGQGVPPAQAVKEIGAVVEGYYAAQSAMTLAEKTGVEMPITQAAYQVLYHGADIRSVAESLMTRAKRSEVEETRCQ